MTYPGTKNNKMVKISEEKKEKEKEKEWLIELYERYLEENEERSCFFEIKWKSKSQSYKRVN